MPAAGVKDVVLHDLRHEGISRLFDLGFQIQEVALVSGHTDWKVLRRYTHIRPASLVQKEERLRAAVAAMKKTGAANLEGDLPHEPFQRHPDLAVAKGST